MEQPPNQQPESTPEPARDEDLGEDHREGAPGYDLDEQQAIQELEREREQGE